MLKLYQFPSAYGIPNLSPFCVKLECFLRMTELEYEIVEFTDPSKGPKGKGPYIEDGDIRMGDSTLIIDYLQRKYDIDVDKHLGSEQKALSHALQCMLEEHLYWIVVYSRWIEDDCWADLNKLFFGGLPPIVNKIVPMIARRLVTRNLHAQGMGRHTRDEIYRFGCSDLDALATLLADKPYIHGDEVSLIDACAYGYLINIFGVPYDNPLKNEALKHSNLRQHTDRMTQRYFG